MSFEPISALLHFAFLGVLFLFLFWVASSARRDLRFYRDSPVAAGAAGGAGFRDAWLIVERSSNLKPGQRFDLFGGLSLGRSGDADVRFTDRYASGIHARVYRDADRYFLEDLNSTNGTLVDRREAAGEVELNDGSRIQIGDTVFRVEID